VRHIIAFEGRETVPGQFLEHGSLKWDEDTKLIVVWQANFDDPRNIIGTGTDIQRDENGVLTAEIEWNDPEKMEQLAKDVAVTIWANEVNADRDKETDNITVHSAKIKALLTTPSVPWVGMSIGDDLDEHMKHSRLWPMLMKRALDGT